MLTVFTKPDAPTWFWSKKASVKTQTFKMLAHKSSITFHNETRLYCLGEVAFSTWFFFLYLFCFLQKHWAGLPLASNQNLCSIKMCFITEIWLTTCVHWTPCHWTIGAESTDDIWLWTSSGWRKAQAKSYCSCLSFLNGWTQQHSESILMNPVCSSLSHSCDLNHRPPLHNL